MAAWMWMWMWVCGSGGWQMAAQSPAGRGKRWQISSQQNQIDHRPEPPGRDARLLKGICSWRPRALCGTLIGIVACKSI